MHALRRILPTLLALAAAAVILVALFSDHRDEYGQVELPRGGVVSLPAGTAKVFATEQGGQRDAHNLAAALSIRVAPVGSGAPLAIEPTTPESTPDALATRSQAIAAAGAVADVEVPAAGEYAVSGEMGEFPTTLRFGETPFTAALGEWKLWGGMLLAAFLISLIPVDRVGRRTGSGATEPLRPAAPVDGSQLASGSPYTPYRG